MPSATIPQAPVALGQQCFAIDDDLALAAEVGGQCLLHRTFEARALGGVLRRPAQDVARAVGRLRAGRAVVGYRELHHEVAAGRQAERVQIEGVGKTLARCVAAAS